MNGETSTHLAVLLGAEGPVVPVWQASTLKRGVILSTGLRIIPCVYLCNYYDGATLNDLNLATTLPYDDAVALVRDGWRADK